MRFDHPQRLTAPAAPGALLKRAMGVAQLMRARQSADNDPVYLTQIRQLPCLKCGMEPAGEAAHVRYASGAHGKQSGMRKTPPDRWTVSLCADCHRNDPDSQHRLGELAFWHLVGLNPLLVCERLYARRGDIVAMRAVVLNAIAERQFSTG
jgi:hypothetical protein